ncbi:hypothetical protein EGW08_011390 [Elysia chlorotica]|uniref:FAD dependent oxidoreductase domain-containing protein n=1 Tax=Elysia chlorotica TaxID=188477 RepID=A0A3S1C265_ELYCH|nr:hypothetical protein EGW08_011390 [Elysia chlorotica]
MVLRIAVIGAGIVGLSTAVSVQARLPEAQVDVIADRFTTHTTSHGSGGLFVPYANNIPQELNDRWCSASAKHFFSVAASSDAGASGVNFVSGFELQALEEHPPPWAKFMINFREIPEQFHHLLKFYKRGYMFTTVIVEGGKYLSWLIQRFETNGGRIIKKKVDAFDELCDDYDLVFNCAGLGAGYLASDPKVQPIRGHIVRVWAPWIKYFVHCDDTHYFLPQSESAAIGGTRQLGRTDMAPEPHESDRILREMRERFPGLEGAKVLYDWVGLRPYRDPVRVEAEVVSCRGKQLKVVHNYGHGAFGISLSWGTAEYAAELAQQALRARPRL